jgi:hypothetical protein
MSRQQFAARNNIGSVLTFQKSGATSSFDPDISFSSGTRRVSWKLNNGTNVTQTAGNGITYTGFTSDTGIRTIEMRGNSFIGLNQFILDGDNLYGNLNLTQLSGLSGIFYVQNNPNLTGITHVPSSQIFTQYIANNCNLTGNLNLPFSGLRGGFWVHNNPNLTGITHVPSSQIFNSYRADNCNLTGNLNVPLSGLRGQFSVYNNSGLTSITHVSSSEIFSDYRADNCDLTGNLNVPLSGLCGIFWVYNNPNLTSITHVPSSQIFTRYEAYNCNLTGNLNLPLSGLGGQFFVNNNPYLTGITHVSSSQIFTKYQASNCDLGYVNFKPLSGATLVSGATVGIPIIMLRDNNMSAADVNHILVDFSGNATHNPTGWSNISLDIGGTNDDPDLNSGGYNGLAAISFLTGSPRNWVITTS